MSAGILVFDENAALRTSANTRTVRAAVDLLGDTGGKDPESFIFPVTIRISAIPAGARPLPFVLAGPAEIESHSTVGFGANRTTNAVVTDFRGPETPDLASWTFLHSARLLQVVVGDLLLEVVHLVCCEAGDVTNEKVLPFLVAVSLSHAVDGRAVKLVLAFR